MENSILKQLGLDTNQILIYEYLLKNGASKASVIAKNTPLKRGLVYKTLDELVEIQIIEKDDPNGAVSIFTPLHPSALKGLAESKVRQAQNTQNHLETDIGSLISIYNLANGKPGIEFYEGIEGIKKVINDTLTSTEIIYTYADIETINKYIPKINEEYATKRDKLGLHKKIIFSDTAYTRKHLPTYHNKTTDSKIISNLDNFATIMQIYNNKISYVTISDEIKMGVIIENKDIYQTHRALFEHSWKTALSL